MSVLDEFQTLIETAGVRSEAATAAVLDALDTSTHARGDRLIEIGDRADRIHFITRGMVRSYFFKDRKDITLSFSAEGEFITSFRSFVSATPSYEVIEWLEDGETAFLLRDDLHALYDRFPEIERLGRVLTEKYYIMMEERLMFFKFKTALERYRDLLDQEPELIMRAPLQYIASYLDISVETLSRIRGKLRDG